MKKTIGGDTIPADKHHQGTRIITQRAMHEARLSPDRSKVIAVLNRELAVGNRGELSRNLTAALHNGPVDVFFCNVHMLMLSQERVDLAAAMDDADYVLPDGIPVAWLQRRLGFPEASVLRGYEAVQAICRGAAAAGKSVGFMGSTTRVLAALTHALEQQHRGLRIAYMHAPPEIGVPIEVDPALIAEINAQELYCLFIGLGCPKQELWTSAYRSHLNCSLLAVGAAFDWLAGTTPKPPAWIENAGLGWLHRLVQNPRRMWHRYLKYNTKFILEVAKLLLRMKFSKTARDNLQQ